MEVTNWVEKLIEDIKREMASHYNCRMKVVSEDKYISFEFIQPNRTAAFVGILYTRPNCLDVCFLPIDDCSSIVLMIAREFYASRIVIKKLEKPEKYELTIKDANQTVVSCSQIDGDENVIQIVMKGIQNHMENPQF